MCLVARFILRVSDWLTACAVRWDSVAMSVIDSTPELYREASFMKLAIHRTRGPIFQLGTNLDLVLCLFQYIYFYYYSMMDRFHLYSKFCTANLTFSNNTQQHAFNILLASCLLRQYDKRDISKAYGKSLQIFVKPPRNFVILLLPTLDKPQIQKLQLPAHD